MKWNKHQIKLGRLSYSRTIWVACEKENCKTTDLCLDPSLIEMSWYLMLLSLMGFFLPELFLLFGCFCCCLSVVMEIWNYSFRPDLGSKEKLMVLWVAWRQANCRNKSELTQMWKWTLVCSQALAVCLVLIFFMFEASL